MKRKMVIALLCIAACALLGACGSTSGTAGTASTAAAAGSTADTGSGEVTAADDETAADDGELEDAESDDEMLDLFDDTDGYETPASEQLVDVNMTNPFGEDVSVKVWDGIENVPDTDDETYSTLSSYANNLSLSHEIVQNSGSAEEVLKSYMKDLATENMSYTNIIAESTRKTDDRAWTMMSFSGKGTTPYAELISVTKLDDGTALKSTVNYYLGVDIYGIDYTPEQKYLTMVMDGLGISKTNGEEITLSADDTKPVINLHAYEFEDSRVGTKSFQVWEEAPYVMTADDEAAYYDDFDFDVDSDVDSMVEDVDEADGEFAFNEVELTDSDFEEIELTESDLEDVDADSDAEYFDDEFYDEDYLDDEYYDEDTADFVAYGSTAAEGVFVNAEMYMKSEDGVAEAMMEEYIDNLAYMGATELKRSEVKTSDSAAWVTVQYGDEADEAYSNLVLVHAIVTDDDTYTTLDIYAPTDASTERLAEYLEAYGLTKEDASIVVEQEMYDFYDEEAIDDSGVETMEDELTLTEDDTESAVG